MEDCTLGATRGMLPKCPFPTKVHFYYYFIKYALYILKSIIILLFLLAMSKIKNRKEYDVTRWRGCPPWGSECVWRVGRNRKCLADHQWVLWWTYFCPNCMSLFLFLLLFLFPFLFSLFLFLFFVCWWFV